MWQSLRHQAWIAALAVVMLFSSLGAARLWDEDEAYFARTAVEMHQRDEWIVPYFNDAVFAHKPPFMFWMMRVGFLLFGVTEFAARFWSAGFGLGTVLLVYHLGRRLFNRSVGLWAGLIMSTALLFDVVARAATPDSFLVFFSTLALYVFVRQERWNEPAAPKSASLTSRSVPPASLSRSVCTAMYAVMGLAVLVKGPIGFLLPGAVLGLYLLVREARQPPSSGSSWRDQLLVFVYRFSPRHFAWTVWALRPFTALTMLLLVAGPWFVLVGWQTQGKFLQEFFGSHNVGRFLVAMDSHQGPIWYYLPATLAGFFPWSVFCIPVVIELGRRCWTHGPDQRGAKFLVCWAGVYVGFFSLASTKLPSYLLPAYPALALGTAFYLNRWFTQPASVQRWGPRCAFGLVLLTGLVIVVAAPVLAGQTGDADSFAARLGIGAGLQWELQLIGLSGLLLAGGAGISLLLAEVRRQRAAILCLTGTGMVFFLAIVAGVTVRIDRYQPSPALAEMIQKHTSGRPRVAQFGYSRPSLVHYADTRVAACKDADEVLAFLDQSADTFVVTTEANYLRLAERLPADVVVIGRCPQFLRRGTVLVLGRKCNP